jgi:NAD-dependent dihydropyrimidine dehydrogenase PreA subunit
MNNMTYLKDVVTLQLDENKCTGCGMCLEVCPHEVYKINTSHAIIENRDACMECGACSRNCPVNAISVASGVGCAAAVINSLLGRKSSACSCSIEPTDSNAKQGGCCC